MSDTCIQTPTAQSEFKTNKCQCTWCYRGQPQQQWCNIKLRFCWCNLCTFSSRKTDDFCVAKWLERAFLVYKVGQHLVTQSEELPVFGQIAAFVCMPSSSDWFIVVQCLQTVTFDSHFQSYIVESLDPEHFTVVSFNHLVDFRPVCFYKNVVGGRTVKFIRLHYHVMPQD